MDILSASKQREVLPTAINYFFTAFNAFERLVGERLISQYRRDFTHRVSEAFDYFCEGRQSHGELREIISLYLEEQAPWLLAMDLHLECELSIYT